MSKYVAKAALRQAKNYTKGYTDIQIKVREATSNDPWGPSGSQMAEIAEATYRAHEFMEIMDIIDKRLNDSGKNWRHVFKALTLLDYLIHSGSEQVIAYAKQNLYVIKTLKEFQFIDEEGKDQGLNVREKSKNIAALLADDDRLKEERQTRANLREKMSKGSSIQGGAGSYYGGGGGDSFSPATPTRRVSYAPSTQYEEEHQLERAIQESKRAAEEQERRNRDLERHERELTMAIESSRAENGNSYQSPFQAPQQQQQPPQQKQEVDLWGGGDQRNHDLDFFSSMAVPAPVSASPADPFGLGTSAASSNAPQPNFFGSGSDFGQSNAFGAPQQQANPFGAQQIAFPPQQQQPQQAFGVQQPQQIAFSSQPVGGGATFDSAFDTGAGQKNLVPRHLQGQGNPNAQLAHIARNAAQIDPFANIAGGGGMNPLQKSSGSAKNSLTDLSVTGFGQPQIARPMQPMPVSSGSSAFGQPSQMQMQPFQSQQQQQPSSVFPPQMGGNAPAGGAFGASSGGFSQAAPPKQGGNDPFASLAPFPQKNPNTPQQQQQQLVASRPQQQQQPQSMGMMSQPGSMMASGAGGMGMGMMAPMSSSAMMPQGMGMNNNPFGQQQQQQQQQRPFQPQQPQQQQQGFGQPQQQNSFFF